MDDEQLRAIMDEARERAAASGEAEQLALARMVHAARTRNALVRHDWQMPEAPTCPECGTKADPIALWTGDGWIPEWDCPNQCLAFCESHVIDWPFVENWADGDDWSALGFEVV